MDRANQSTEARKPRNPLKRGRWAGEKGRWAGEKSRVRASIVAPMSDRRHAYDDATEIYGRRAHPFGLAPERLSTLSTTSQCTPTELFGLAAVYAIHSRPSGVRGAECRVSEW